MSVEIEDLNLVKGDLFYFANSKYNEEAVLKYEGYYVDANYNKTITYLFNINYTNRYFSFSEKRLKGLLESQLKSDFMRRIES